MKLLSFLACAAALSLAACESTPTIKTDMSPGANFAQYSTYEWIYQKPPTGMNPIMYQRIHDAIDAAMRAKGYTENSPGDIAIAFTVGAQDKVDVTDWGPYYYGRWGGGWGGAWGGGTQVTQYKEGTLAVDVYDVGTKRPLWHGVATDRIYDSSADPAKVQLAVSQVMAQLPAH